MLMVRRQSLPSLKDFLHGLLKVIHPYTISPSFDAGAADMAIKSSSTAIPDFNESLRSCGWGVGTDSCGLKLGRDVG